MPNIPISIESPVKYYDFKDQHGELLATLRFSPSDVDIFDRHKAVLKDFENMQQELKSVVEKAESVTDEMSIELKKEYADRMKKEFDYLFNSDTSGFFKVASPFTPLDNGEPWALAILKNVLKIIENETGKNMAAMKSNASKYTEKYKAAPGKYPFPVG